MAQEIVAEYNVRSKPREPLKDATFWGVCLGHALTHWLPSTFYILLPYMSMSFGLTATQAGSLAAVMYITGSISNIPMGMITDRSTRKGLMMVVSLTMVGFPFLFLGIAQWYWLLVILVMMMGIGKEIWHPPSISTLSFLYPERRGFVLGCHGMSANVGDALAPVISGALIVALPWQNVVSFNSIPWLIVGVLVLFLLRKQTTDNRENDDKKNETTKNYKQALMGLLRNRPVLLLALVNGIRTMSQNGIMTFLPLYLALELELSPLWVGVYLSILQGGGLLASPIAGALSDKTGRRKVVMSGMVLSSFMILTVTFVKIDWLLVAVIALLGFFLYALRPVMHAWTMENTSQNMAGTTTSLVFTIQALLASLSPLIGGVLADQFGFMAAFYFLAVVILTGNIVVAFIPKPPISDIR